ncbi:DNA-directed RNA polymerase mitochondrial precursor [Trematosphaeria pertusa]|uniref:DNA-directed RNA polymerase n=1 Tax=Trematosphaeria pertusa TaxID=390896 RepID=A0A6A6HSV3_9PLEO|nr:DNA-directed RNA polymerase mitochondrial precursor [Trematosphaeria pertusa]KAF2241091.1 DNA-directed RNA polymerase mitochondrial precursor [Trematosphaeria pertusa]
MLARAARRKLRRDAFRAPTQLAEQLALPWLCPAQMRWAASVGPMPANSNSKAHDARKQRHAPSLSPRHKTRSLATAADVQPSPLTVPFDGFLPPWGSRVQRPSAAKLQPWDPSNPLILHDPLAAPTTPFKYGIGGDPIELHQNLYACLRVGRLDRATAIVERLATMYNPSAPEVVDAHNVFLQTMFELAQQNPTPASLADIEQWYDAHMVRQAIEPSAQTFVTLLRASMNLLEGGQKDAAIRKYLAMAHQLGPDVVEDINSSPDFSDDEWDTLIRFQPDMFTAPPRPVEEMQSIEISTPAGHAALIEHGFLPNPAHTIKPVLQKGRGLDALKKSLAIFEPGKGVAYPNEMEGTQEDKERAYAYMRQLRTETDATNAAIERWKAEDAKLQGLGIHGVLKTKPVQALMWNWYSALLPLIKKEIAATKEVLSTHPRRGAGDDRLKYGPFLELCNPEKLAAVTVSRVIAACARGGARDQNGSLKVSVLTTAIGHDIENEINADAKQRHDASVRKHRSRARKDLLGRLARTSRETAPSPKPDVTEDVQKDDFERRNFPLAIRARIGALALEHLMQAAMVTVNAEDPKTGKQLTSTQPAFHHHTGFTQGRKVGWIAPHHEIMKKLRNEPLHSVSTHRLPMIFEPKPWASFDDGGYYTGRELVIRTKAADTSQRAYAHSAISNGDMGKVLAGLDVLGKVPWQINRDVFTVMAQAWNAGEGVGGLVAENADPGRPAEPGPEASPEERSKWTRKVKEYENVKSGLHSQRCFQNFQLEIAKGYLKEKKIYFPHSVDFRGRAYPIPPILNHIGADMARGLLKFANGKELGAVGLQWLKVHLANLYGYDKASLRERENFAMDNINEIYDSATNPLSGRRWWAKAEDPWQCLACCIELKNALDSPDPTRFVSRLPVHQDGTCNGLQHYAALGGDHAGASQVNLEPSDRPQDIYTGVAEIVKEMVVKDAADGHVVAQFVKDKITRKVVKRTVMTNVYGVTFMGAKLQVLDELKEIFPNFQETDKIRSLATPALYVAMKIFHALGRIFNGAQEIQYWLGECGDRITTSLSAEQIKKIQERLEGKAASYDAKYKQPEKFGPASMKKLNKSLETFKNSIIWTTPLKMPVVQPYRKHNSHVVKTSLQDITVINRSRTDMVDKRKQLQAFPPNFIHSLDASHMLLSALKCNELGLDFAAVHDSFWTHAADIPNLNVVLRDAFVRMHSEDIIGRLAAEFKARYAGSMYRANITTTSRVGQKIAAWRRKHRSVKRAVTAEGKTREASFEEVALEAKRQELLNSEDPAKRKEGEEMVTPTSIWLADQDPLALASFRLSLLGETKQKSGQKFDEVKEKVLSAEAEAIRDDTGASIAAAPAIEGEADITEPVEPDAELEEPEMPTERTGMKPTKRYATKTIQAWLPLTFPPVPQKGSWDVTRLRESKYFFS